MKTMMSIIRRLGNDLEGRHGKNQTYKNTKFIIDNEPEHEFLKRVWLLNRIVDKDAESKIIDLLNDNHEEYFALPFKLEHYKEFYNNKKINDQKVLFNIKEKGILRHNKILYLINNNFSRNSALEYGLNISDWTIPSDGGCCFTEDGLNDFISIVSKKPLNLCFAVPMYRLKDNSEYFSFSPKDKKESEPQIVFGRKSGLRFNLEYGYDWNDKVELIKRLGLPYEGTSHGTIITEQRYKAGYVVRLSSGNMECIGSWPRREELREKAIDRHIKMVDEL